MNKTLRRTELALAALCVLAGAAAAAAAALEALPPLPPGAAASVSPDLYAALRYRMIGPWRGGRSSAVTGVSGQPHTFFMGSAGGVWKSANAGTTWENVSDGSFACSSIGAIAVSESDPNVVYVGTGQATIRGNVAAGCGMYKSTDGGRTWAPSGLGQVGQIARLRVHPRNPDLVYAAVVGEAFVPSEQRGVYRSRDGGKTWERVLFVSAKTGFADLAMDPSNPRVLYASAWTVQRKPWTIVSGSEEGGLYKSADGGETWSRLGGGLPGGVVGKIGVAVSPANPRRVWALVEAEHGGLFRSEDAGATWALLETNMTRRLLQRSWYFVHVVADPLDEQAVYVLNVDQFRSRDGGKTFEMISGVEQADGHDLWIDPRDSRTMIWGGDEGALVSLDGGQTWSSRWNQPTAEVYYAAVDDRVPYRVYGAQQDNSTVSISSRASSTLAPHGDVLDVGGCEDGQIAVDPRTPDIVYAGCYGGEITRKDLRNGDLRFVLAYPQMEVGMAPRDLRYRFNWNAPVRVSRHDPRILWHGAQKLLRSEDEGQTWAEISPDLTRNDPAKQDYAGEPITKENTGVEVYDSLLALEESPLEAGVLWAGSDDGLVHLTRDAGATWKAVTPPGLPEWSAVNSIAPSPHASGRALVAALAYKLGDRRPYVFRTDDFGASWVLLTDGANGIPADLPVRVVREDPEQRGLLFAGTESGVYFSLDDGRRWQALRLNLPPIPVNDVRIHQGDLVLATQGRGLWILDDLTPLRELARDASWAGPARLAPPRPALRIRQAGGDGNPPDGAAIYYWLGASATGEVKLDVLDPEGRLVQSFSSEHPPSPHPEFPYAFMGDYAGDGQLAKGSGLHRFVWDLRWPPVDFPPGTIVWGMLQGPKVAPGSYKVVLSVNGRVVEQPLTVTLDPRLPASAADLVAQQKLMLELRDQLDGIYGKVHSLRSLRAQLAERIAGAKAAGKDVDALGGAADELARRMSDLEGELMQPRNEADQDTENYPTQLDNQIAYLLMWMDAQDSRPTQGQIDRAADLERAAAAAMAKADEVLGAGVAGFNREAERYGVPGVQVPRP